jgi:predicted CoA-substrate-specific enzyme activase
MELAVGIDVGSVAAKGACFDNGKVLATVCMPNAARYDDTVRQIVERLLVEMNLPLDTPSHTVACGYGRDMAQANGGTVNEIIANVKGVLYQCSENDTPGLIVNIGGQDIKVIFLDQEGNIDRFVFNDKCAAGTGRFFETLARILHLDIVDLGHRGNTAENPVKINSTCVVFAENEIINLLAKGFESDTIIAGFNRAVAERIRNMAGAHNIPNTVVIDGGVALNKSFIQSLADVFGSQVKILSQPQRTTAIGAAIISWERLQEMS